MEELGNMLAGVVLVTAEIVGTILAFLAVLFIGALVLYGMWQLAGAFFELLRGLN